jgi:hypothetical protein
MHGLKGRKCVQGKAQCFEEVTNLQQDSHSIQLHRVLDRYAPDNRRSVHSADRYVASLLIKESVYSKNK